MPATPAIADTWPDGLDLAATLGFFVLAVGLPALGYAWMVLDVRAYLRSLRRHLVRAFHWHTHTPEWALQQTPRCLVSFGLELPCGEAELLAAYRERVKELHPDHGGDERRFLAMQAQFEEALRVVRSQGETAA